MEDEPVFFTCQQKGKIYATVKKFLTVQNEGGKEKSTSGKVPGEVPEYEN